jgi:prolyl-tRNA synthetase
MKPGPKFYEWERKGVPVRIEVGPKDIAKGSLMLVQRVVFGDAQRKEPLEEQVAIAGMPHRLQAMQQSLLNAARERREANTHRGITDYGEMKRSIEDRGGFYFAGWCGSADCEQRVKEETKATIRVLPFEEFRSSQQPERCIVCASAAHTEAVWAKAY